jgi:hypothetical protein
VRVAPLLGEFATLHGLQSKPELNGDRAEVVAYVGAKGRYAVRLLRDRTQMTIKPANLRVSWRPEDEEEDEEVEDGDEEQEKEDLAMLLEDAVAEGVVGRAEVGGETARLEGGELSVRQLIGELEARLRCAHAARTNAAKGSYLVQMVGAQLAIAQARYALRGAVGGRYTPELVGHVSAALEGGLVATDEALRTFRQIGTVQGGKMPAYAQEHVQEALKTRSAVMCELAGLAGEESRLGAEKRALYRRHLAGGVHTATRSLAASLQQGRWWAGGAIGGISRAIGVEAVEESEDESSDDDDDDDDDGGGGGGGGGGSRGRGAADERHADDTE